MRNQAAPAARVGLRKRPMVSVCIVNWNCRAQLRTCLCSLAGKRQGVRLEIIVVDNASSDGAAEMVAAEFPRVSLIRNAGNEGYAFACNQAAAFASGRYLFFLNNDTIIPRSALRRLLNVARANPALGLLGPRLRDRRGRVQRSVRAAPSVAALCHRLTLLRWTGLFRAAHDAYRGGRTSKEPHSAAVLMGAALLMPRTVWQEVGGWDERYAFGGEDIDLCLRVAKRWQVIHDPRTHIVHLGRVASQQRPEFVQGSTLVGITRSLRTAGTHAASLLAYKAAFTLDIPFRMAELVGRWLWDKLRGRSSRRAWLDLAGLASFTCRHLFAFWRV